MPPRWVRLALLPARSASEMGARPRLVESVASLSFDAWGCSEAEAPELCGGRAVQRRLALPFVDCGLLCASHLVVLLGSY